MKAMQGRDVSGMELGIKPDKDVCNLLFIPDCHWKRCNIRNWNVMMDVAGHRGIDKIVQLGDFADCKSVSAHKDNSANREFLLDELESVKAHLRQLVRELAPNQFIYIFGNHEDRIDRYIADHAPKLEGLINYPQLVGLKELGIDWVQYGESVKLGKINYTHDLDKAGENAHKQAASVFRGSAIIGHTHQMAMSVSGTVNDSPTVAAMFGWLGSEDAAKSYKKKAAQRAHWSQGFGLGQADATGATWIQPVPIVNGKCIVDGKVFK